jgi:hypothetical protein
MSKKNNKLAFEKYFTYLISLVPPSTTTNAIENIRSLGSLQCSHNNHLENNHQVVKLMIFILYILKALYDDHQNTDKNLRGPILVQFLHLTHKATFLIIFV